MDLCKGPRKETEQDGTESLVADSLSVCSKRSLEVRGSFAGLWTASNLFISCSLLIHKCLMVPEAPGGIAWPGEHPPPPYEVGSLVTSLSVPECWEVPSASETRENGGWGWEL